MRILVRNFEILTRIDLYTISVTKYRRRVSLAFLDGSGLYNLDDLLNGSGK